MNILAKSRFDEINNIMLENIEKHKVIETPD